jgi:hypothetical protein
VDSKCNRDLVKILTILPKGCHPLECIGRRPARAEKKLDIKPSPIKEMVFDPPLDRREAMKKFEEAI